MLAGLFADVTRRGRRYALRALVAVLAALPPAGFAAAQAPQVSFEPAADSPDYADLFAHPERWANTRRHIDAFVLSPPLLKHGGSSNSLDTLVAADAFRKLQQWGLKTEIAVGAIKEWDCAAQTTPTRTIDNIAAVRRNGGAVQLVAMDEPLLAAIRPQTNAAPRCNIGLAQAAVETAAFAKQVTAGVAAQQLGPAPGFIDVESYPSISLEQHEAYVTALLAQGFRPAGYQLDIAIGRINLQPAAQQRFPADMRALAAFLAARQIPLGIILWSSRDPEPTDQAYYQDTLAFTRQIHGILGTPPGVLFSSWVRRCAAGSDIARCSKSVPVNLPDGGPNVFSHTRLILDALAILAQR